MVEPASPERLSALFSPSEVLCRTPLEDATAVIRELVHTITRHHNDVHTPNAINQFTAHNVSELPVLDKDGDLVGVVTENELLHVCLPDYILWMDDLSPIMAPHMPHLPSGAPHP